MSFIFQVPSTWKIIDMSCIPILIQSNLTYETFDQSKRGAKNIPWIILGIDLCISRSFRCLSFLFLLYLSHTSFFHIFLFRFHSFSFSLQEDGFGKSFELSSQEKKLAHQLPRSVFVELVFNILFSKWRKRRLHIVFRST